MLTKSTYGRRFVDARAHGPQPYLAEQRCGVGIRVLMIDHQDIVDGQQRHPHLMRHLVHQPGERHFALAVVRLQSVNENEREDEA